LVEAEDLGSMSLLALMTTHHCRQTWRRNKEDIAGNRPTIILSIRQRDMRVESTVGGACLCGWYFVRRSVGCYCWVVVVVEVGRWSHASSR
jgi:hypothetical protein